MPSFQSPSRRGVNYFMNSHSQGSGPSGVSVPFAKGRQLLLVGPENVADAFACSFSPLREGASITSSERPTAGGTLPKFQSPSRRGVNYFYWRSGLVSSPMYVSVPFAKGRQLLLVTVSYMSVALLCFSPLREGASITSDAGNSPPIRTKSFQSPSRRGVNTSTDTGMPLPTITAISVPFAKGRQLLPRNGIRSIRLASSFQSPSRRGVNYFLVFPVM